MKNNNNITDNRRVRRVSPNSKRATTQYTKQQGSDPANCLTVTCRSLEKFCNNLVKKNSAINKWAKQMKYVKKVKYAQSVKVVIMGSAGNPEFLTVEDSPKLTLLQKRYFISQEKTREVFRTRWKFLSIMDNSAYQQIVYLDDRTKKFISLPDSIARSWKKFERELQRISITAVATGIILKLALRQISVGLITDILDLILHICGINVGLINILKFIFYAFKQFNAILSER